MSDVNLKELAAAKPYGAARKALEKAGLWDPHGDGETSSFIVELSAECRARTTLTVTARNEDEAAELALKAGERMAIDGWDRLDGIEDIDVEDVTRKTQP